METKDQGNQCEVLQREYIPAKIQSTFFLESEGWGLFYRSHTVTVMIGLLWILYVSSTKFQGETLYESVKYGYLFALLIFCGFAASYFPNPLIQRPHPLFWRLLSGWACFYLITIVFLLFFSPKQLQEFFRLFIDSELGQALPQKSYAEDCRVYTPENEESQYYNIYSSIDVFFLAHVCGWTVKMWILRDFKLAMIQQILFEGLELTFRHWLPNFYECWWDHIILDILICNTGGILLGWITMKIFGMKNYRWSLANQNKLSYWQNFQRLCVNPQLDILEWKVFSSVKRFLSVIWFMILMNLVDLSYFFNKYVLSIPVSHDILKFRTFPLGFFSIVAARDYYVYISDDNVTRMGSNCWLMHMIILSEWLLFLKNEQGRFTQSFPPHVIFVWTLIFIFMVFQFIIYYQIASMILISIKNKKIKQQ